jgi:hypothetical protein
MDRPQNMLGGDLSIHLSKAQKVLRLPLFSDILSVADDIPDIF